ncbi:hypothetical protein, partial [Burkholderia pseudomallei]|uniref:hypothetical protein n=1 Tax=Burkholderia pseudomallei TaxID=28450 RepID=UPI0021F718CD
TAVLASRPFRASLSSAQDHEHDISNAPLATPVYTVSNFNSLLDDPPRRRTGMAEFENWAHVMALRDAEQAVLVRYWQQDTSVNGDCIDDAIAHEYKERYAWYLATAIIEEIHWRTGHEMTRSRPIIAEPSAPISQRRAGIRAIRQRKRPHRS